MTEALVRDLLASDLSVLETGLKLLDIEKFIPSELGTRSFLDLLAKDHSGHWVIIEVKKTNAAAREAAHEVFKYAEAVQRHFGARNDEVRVIVASVEWKELLVPFSRLKAETSISVDGFLLELDAAGKTIKAAYVEAVPVNLGRYLAPWHELNLYHDQASLERGIASYDECCKEKGIEDYVLVVLKAAEDFNERAADALTNTLQVVQAMFESKGHEDNYNFSAVPLARYEYILYFTPQILSREFCLDVIAREPTLLEEVECIKEDMSKEEELCMLHGNVYDLEPRPVRDYFDIGYAAKFKDTLLDDEGWTVEQVLRRGMFARNNLLSDDAIIDELKGLTGSSGQGFKSRINMANRAHVASARADLSTALATNPSWHSQINRILDDVQKDTPEALVDINVFCPSSGVFTLYFMATSEDSISYMPSYQIEIMDTESNITKFYVGLLVPSGQPATFDQILEKYYDNRIGALMFLAGAGFYETRDADVMDDLGLVYRSFRVDGLQGDAKWFELKDERWRAFKPDLPFQPLQPYFDANGPLIKLIVNEIGSRMHGGIHDLS
ncbi:MAG: endonuclease NucS [Methylobacter sp.]|nr:endonuclease NucS [Methylobacter sp.]